ncbi:MAG: molybdopterin-dependent oxidoreductase, partial [Acidimicrobiia bacterium]
PPGADLGVPGAPSFLTPVTDFYRVDTAVRVPFVDLSSWRLRIGGLAGNPFALSYDDLLALPFVEEVITLVCVSNEPGGELAGTARWSGVPLSSLLDRARPHGTATQVLARSVDGFSAGFPLDHLAGRPALVALAMNGEPLPAVHGFPARLVVADLYGYASATKWLSDVELTDWESRSYWVERGWAREAPVRTMSRIDVPRHAELLAPGPAVAAGVAWATGRGISRVEVQVDGGPWIEAELGSTPSSHTWVQWWARWEATEGVRHLRVRATDGAGEPQTERRQLAKPRGASGLHTRIVRVRG